MIVFKVLFSAIQGIFKTIFRFKILVFNLFFVLFVIGGLILGFGAYMEWMNVKPLVKANLERYKNEVSNVYDSNGTKPIKIYDINSKLIGEFNRKNFKPIRTDNLKNHGNLVWALLSSEDRDFYSHGGINYFAIFRAVVVNLSKMKLLQGGSTITQQLAKLTLSLGERNIFNKITEAFCTYYIESEFDKDTILSMYMNQIFLGEGNVGLEEASRYYFNKSAASLNPAEAALLIGVIPAPSVYNPIKNMGISLDRQKRILFDMVRFQSLHFQPNTIEKDFGKKIDENIRQFKSRYNIKEVQVGEKTKYTSDIGKFGFDRSYKVNLAPDFNDSIRRYILDRFTNEELERSSLKVYTTLDYDKQAIAEAALREGIEDVRKVLDKEKQAYLKKDLTDEAKKESEIIANMNGSIVSLNPYNGYVEALVGAYKISPTYRLNRAEEARRQPGSVIKGIVYALALERKVITPASYVIDEKININGYSPKNWYAGYKGQITARQAFAQSVNTVSVKLLQEIGVGYFLEKMSLILSIPKEELKERFEKNLSLALGSGELTPMELAIIYSTIANGGKKVNPQKIIKIEDEEGIDRTPVDIYHQETPEQIIDPTACAMAVNLMEAVVSEEGTMPLRFKDKEKDKFPAAGKTGTVQTPKKAQEKWGKRKGIRDSWFAGIFPNNVTAIWVGNDQGAPFPGSGSGVSGQIWIKYATYINRKVGLQAEPLIKPFDGDYIQADICGESGSVLSETEECKYPLYNQYFYKGTEPRGKPQEKQTTTPIFKPEEEGNNYEDEPEFEINTQKTHTNDGPSVNAEETEHNKEMIDDPKEKPAGEP